MDPLAKKWMVQGNGDGFRIKYGISPGNEYLMMLDWLFFGTTGACSSVRVKFFMLMTFVELLGLFTLVIVEIVVIVAQGPCACA